MNAPFRYASCQIPGHVHLDLITNLISGIHDAQVCIRYAPRIMTSISSLVGLDGMPLVQDHR